MQALAARRPTHMPARGDGENVPQFAGQQADRLRMPLPLPTRDPLEQAIIDRLRIRTTSAPSMTMTAFVGGVIGAAAGFATDGKTARYGALGAAIGLAGGFAYGVYNSRVAAQKALDEHQALLAASIKSSVPSASRGHAARPPTGVAAHRAGYAHSYGGAGDWLPWE
jgi:hypothetical protein